MTNALLHTLCTSVPWKCDFIIKSKSERPRLGLRPQDVFQYMMMLCSQDESASSVPMACSHGLPIWARSGNPKSWVSTQSQDFTFFRPTFCTNKNVSTICVRQMQEMIFAAKNKCLTHVFVLAKKVIAVPLCAGWWGERSVRHTQPQRTFQTRGADGDINRHLWIMKLRLEVWTRSWHGSFRGT